jgi:hypothetical protein
MKHCQQNFKFLLGILIFKELTTRGLYSSFGINPLMPNGHYSGRTAPLTSRHYILNIYSPNIRTECFKHAA